MSVLPINTALGVLEIIEVYEYYDRPVLFACQNQVGNKYIATWVDETDDAELWFYVPISQRRFEQIRSGAIDLHTAFAKAEGDSLFSVLIPFSEQPESNQIVVKALYAPSIPSSQFPEPGERLDLPTITIPNTFDTPKKRAQQTRYEQIDLSIRTIEQERTEVPASQLGNVLQRFQQLVNNIGNKKFGLGNVKGAFSLKVVNNMELKVIGFGPGSFRVHIASSSSTNLFDESDVGDVVDEILGIVRLSEDSDQLHARMMDLGSRVASSYVEFLEAIKFDLTSIQIEWGSPHPDRGGVATMTSEVAQRTVNIIKSFEEQSVREYEVTAILISANLRTLKIEMAVGESSIVGEVDKAAGEIMEGAIIGATYKVRLQETQFFKPMVEESSLRYTVMGWEYVSRD
jgi:hypothetical protein